MSIELQASKDLPVDTDAQETQEWMDALSAVIEREGPERAHFLIEQMIAQARRTGINIPYSANTEYINTIPVAQQPPAPGDYAIEARIRSYIRWNALAMVMRANQRSPGLGGHIASFASAATLFDVGFNHFWHAPTENHGGDMVFFQGHSSPGLYARAFLLDQLSEEQLDHFRHDVDGKGMPSYPHPWLMPGFWKFPTVSMGLGPLQAIYQARFIKYMICRGHLDAATHAQRKVWAFMGDGEMDEPESMGEISMAARENLDNLIFVVNCNLQRLDGPVRGNGKIIQELEADFRGAGWNVIKLVWGSYWDELLAQDKSGLLRRRMMECVDGDYQTYKSKDGAYVRKHFFGKYPELAKMVAHWPDDDIWNLNRGGHDPHKIYAAYHAAIHHRGQPTVILAKTIKGYGMGDSGQAQNITHQQKKMGTTSLKDFRDRFQLPIADEDLEKLPYLKFPADSPELAYMRSRRQALGGPLLSRRQKVEPLPMPSSEAYAAFHKSPGAGREISTTMAFVRILNMLVKDKHVGARVVPIVPDESRTFGMEGMFRQLGIWNQLGQLYTPQDAEQLMFYKESKTGQILQEGINEAGGMADWIAASTSYSNHGVQMLPVYIFYSMFGMQRTMDLVWAAADQRARGFLMGATAGRTTLNGEGLQHADGHSHVLAATIPNCVSYDPTFAYELAVIVEDGLRRMFTEQEDVFYYITVMNENYEHPDMPADKQVAADILKGMYRFSPTVAKGKGKSQAARVQLLGSGTIFREVMAAAELLRQDWGVEADLWSCPSFTELARDGQDCARRNLLNPGGKQCLPHVTQCLQDTQGPVIAATDYIRMFAEQIRPYVPRAYTVLGTDGFGRSDTRETLRDFFEVDRRWIALAALRALADEGQIAAARVKEALAKYGMPADKPNPLKV